jgi:hypothetical protein
MVPRSELSVLGVSAVHDFAESFTEVIRKKGVQDGVNTRIHIGQDVTHYLNHNTGVGDLVPVDTLQHQDQLQTDITKL